MEQKNLKIFVHKDVPRLRYILSIIFVNILGVEYEIVADKRKLGKGPVINYSEENIEGAFRIIPDTILFESGINERKLVFREWKGLPVFFISDNNPDLPFDIFAASFYLITCYEEHLKFKPDEHGRFPEEESLGFKHDFINRPVIDLYARELSLELLKRFQYLTFRRNEFRSLTTIDVDQPFAYKGKGLFWSIGGLVKDIFKKHLDVIERVKCLFGMIKDPYDVFDYLVNTLENNNTKAIFFFPVGKRSDFDKNPGFRSMVYKELIGKVIMKYDIGIHPSYLSSVNTKLVEREIKKFRIISGKEPLRSRQHYLKIRFPETFRNLIRNNINEDYSLGYVNRPGFRAGIARPFRYFDLMKNEETSLTLIPFQIMDGALLKNCNDIDKALGTVEMYIRETRQVGGLFVTIWHNTSLTDDGEWKGWRRVFEFVLNEQDR